MWQHIGAISASGPSDFISRIVLLDLCKSRAVGTIMPQQAMPVLLCAEIRRVPAEIVDAHCAMRHRLLRPQTQLPRLGLGEKVG